MRKWAKCDSTTSNNNTNNTTNTPDADATPDGGGEGREKY